MLREAHVIERARRRFAHDMAIAAEFVIQHEQAVIVWIVTDRKKHHAVMADTDLARLIVRGRWPSPGRSVRHDGGAPGNQNLERIVIRNSRPSALAVTRCDRMEADQRRRGRRTQQRRRKKAAGDQRQTATQRAAARQIHREDVVERSVAGMVGWRVVACHRVSFARFTVEPAAVGFVPAH